MTDQQAREIATHAVTLHDATADLRVYEMNGAKREAQVQRRRAAAAQAALDKAISAAVER